MEKIIHRAEDRGKGEYGWLSTRYSFSFANWYEPTRMGFGALRVLNDDTIAPAAGFPPHSHRDMEIITVVTDGTLAHRDSLGNSGLVPAGDVQVMSAGTGITHAEYNASETEPLSLFQIWIATNKRGSAPRYAQKTFKTSEKEEFVCFVGNELKTLSINQNAFIGRACVNARKPFRYKLHHPDHGVYVFVIEGKAEVEGVALQTRDALGITGAPEFRIETPESAQVLIIEVPMVS